MSANCLDADNMQIVVLVETGHVTTKRQQSRSLLHVSLQRMCMPSTKDCLGRYYVYAFFQQKRRRSWSLLGMCILFVNWWCFEPSPPLGIISGLKETFIKRNTVERTNKEEVRPEEQSGNGGLPGEFVEWNSVERAIKTEIYTRTELRSGQARLVYARHKL